MTVFPPASFADSLVTVFHTTLNVFQLTQGGDVYNANDMQVALPMALQHYRFSCWGETLGLHGHDNTTPTSTLQQTANGLREMKSTIENGAEDGEKIG